MLKNGCDFISSAPLILEPNRSCGSYANNCKRFIHLQYSQCSSQQINKYQRYITCFKRDRPSTVTYLGILIFVYAVKPSG